ncbi:hypothetical protein BH09ACT4_BH09ACT4_23360 [soil metagenome]
MSDLKDPGHGNSPAAWVAVIIMLVAVALGTFGFWFDVPVVVWASVGLLVVGALTGLVMKKLGYGVNGPKYVPKTHN